MLPKKNKLTRAHFGQFLSLRPFSAFNRVGTFKFFPIESNFSAVVSSKHCKKSVLRNKTRRRAYRIIAEKLKKKHAPLSGILYFSKQAYTMPLPEFELLVQQLLDKAYVTQQNRN